MGAGRIRDPGIVRHPPEGRRPGACTVEEPPAMVKAATFHGLKVEEADGGLQAEVIFDV